MTGAIYQVRLLSYLSTYPLPGLPLSLTPVATSAGLNLAGLSEPFCGAGSILPQILWPFVSLPVGDSGIRGVRTSTNQRVDLSIIGSTCLACRAACTCPRKRPATGLGGTYVSRRERYVWRVRSRLDCVVINAAVSDTQNITGLVGCTRAQFPAKLLPGRMRITLIRLTGNENHYH